MILGRSGEEYSPEMVNIVLVEANARKGANVVKGIRAVLEYCTGLNSLTDATRFWERWETGERPLVLVESTELTTARAAAEAGQKASGGNLTLGIGLSVSQIEGLAMTTPAAAEKPAARAASAPKRLKAADLFPGPDADPPPGWTPSFAAAQTAVALLTQRDGNAVQTIAWARILGHTTGSPVFEDVVRLIVSSLPAHDPGEDA